LLASKEESEDETQKFGWEGGKIQGANTGEEIEKETEEEDKEENIPEYEKRLRTKSRRKREGSRRRKVTGVGQGIQTKSHHLNQTTCSSLLYTAGAVRR
jgi:hypothetical protein